MRRVVVIGAVLLGAFLLGAVLAAAWAGPAQAGAQDFELQNRTGYRIDAVYISRNSSARWGADVIGADTLQNGRTIGIAFTAPADACRWDMKVRYHDGGEATWSNLDLCDIGKLTLYWDWRRQITRAVTE